MEIGRKSGNGSDAKTLTYTADFYGTVIAIACSNEILTTQISGFTDNAVYLENQIIAPTGKLHYAIGKVAPGDKITVVSYGTQGRTFSASAFSLLLRLE